MSEIKGFVTFFINITDQVKVGLEEYIQLQKSINQPVIDAMAKEGYVSMFIPC